MHRLQYVTQGKDPQEHLNNLKSALEAGVKLIQLRLKEVSEEIYLETALKASELCKKHSAQLIINDDPSVAKKVEAFAVHLGLEDMKVDEARKISSLQIGGTANTFEHIQQRTNEKVNYIGLGPYKFTTTKKKLSPVLGVEGYKKIIDQMKKENSFIPVYAIGGIELEDIEGIMSTGVYGIAVSGLITHSPNKKELVEKINKILDHVENSK
jgi:thiamine-phosphate pyrophosphorylase